MLNGCPSVPIPRLLTMFSLVYLAYSVLNMKALIGTFNQEETLVGVLFRDNRDGHRE